MMAYGEDMVPKEGRPPFIPPGLPGGHSAGYFPWYISLWDNWIGGGTTTTLILWISYRSDSFGISFIRYACLTAA